MTANLCVQGNATDRRVSRTFHDQPVGIERLDEFARHARAISCLGFQPVKSHTEMRAAGATTQTWMHDVNPRRSGGADK